MSMRERGSGGVMRDGATNTGLAAVIIVVAVVVAVLLLHHTGSTKVASGSTTATGPTTTIIPGATTTTVAGGSPGSTSSTGSTTSTSLSSTTTTVAPANIKVLVLNGASFTLPLATEFTTKIKDLGYQALTPNNASGTVKASIIYVVTTGYAPEADALAKSLGLTSAAVTTTLITTAPLSSGTAATGANLVLVVGPDLASKG